MLGEGVSTRTEPETRVNRPRRGRGLGRAPAGRSAARTRRAAAVPEPRVGVSSVPLVFVHGEMA